MGGDRIEKVAERLRHELSKIIQQELKDPRIGFVTVTGVNITKDLRLARVYFSVLGDKAQKEGVQKGLESATGFIKKLIGQRIRLRYTPDLEFRLDESIEYCQHIDEVLKRIEEKKKGR